MRGSKSWLCAMRTTNRGHHSPAKELVCFVQVALLWELGVPRAPSDGPRHRSSRQETPAGHAGSSTIPEVSSSLTQHSPATNRSGLRSPAGICILERCRAPWTVVECPDGHRRAALFRGSTANRQLPHGPPVRGLLRTPRKRPWEQAASGLSHFACMA